MRPLPYSTRVQRGFAKIDTDLLYLMRCFQEVLIELGESEIAARLPWVGRKRTRPGRRTFPPRLAHAYSIAFHLLNMVEENTAVQMRRAGETANGLDSEPGMWGQQLRQLLEAGHTVDEICAWLPWLRVEPVLTAHPTEAKRRTVLEQHRHLYLLLVRRENPIWTPSEQADLREDIKTAIERLWRTGEMFLSKPTVAMERAGVLHHLVNVLPDALRRVDLRLRDAWEAAGLPPDRLADPAMLPRLRFGTWVGGDRDGHPLVTPEVTAESLRDYRRQGLLLLRGRLRQLGAGLSLSRHLQTPPEILLEALGRVRKEAGGGQEPAATTPGDEPWRDYAALLESRLPLAENTVGETVLDDVPGTYVHSYELEKDLRLLRESLLAVGARRLVESDVDPLLRLVEVFGFHLAALDVRQNSRFHDLAVEQILAAAGATDTAFGAWDEARRLAFLNDRLARPDNLLEPGTRLGPEAAACLGLYRVLADHATRYGTKGLGVSIVSMTRQASDLLVVYFFAKEAGLTAWKPYGLVCQMPVVPLFETIGDLEAAPGILREFLDHPVTRSSMRWLHDSLVTRRGERMGAHLLAEPGGRDTGRHHGLIRPTLQVMIGYSDSNKDGGILASQWALHRAQTGMAHIAAERGTRIRFFHGRGGTISRGAGPTHRFLEALPAGTLYGDLRITEQGEAVSQKYSNLITAAYNLELLLAGTCRFSFDPPQSGAAHGLEKTMERLVAGSHAAYRALLEDEGFMEFYREATPIDVLEASSIGSRPARRTGTRTLDDLRAIPWVFSWSQSRFFLPGWFGVGSALEALRREHPEDFAELGRMLPAWPFLRYVLTNVETSHASADARIMERYAGLVHNAEVRERLLGVILRELELTRETVASLFGRSREERRPRFARTIEKRADALLALHDRQIGLLAQWRAAGRGAGAENLLIDLLQTVNALAGGLRTTG